MSPTGDIALRREDAPAGRLQLLQSSAWNGFRYGFLDAQGTSLGGFEFPNFGQARNARLAFHPPGSVAGDIRLVLEGEDYRVDFEYLTRSWNNDLRYCLLHRDAVCATIDINQVKGRRWPDITLRMIEGTRTLHTAKLQNTGHWWRSVFELREPSGDLLAHIEEPNVLTLKRRYHIDSARLPRAVKGFLGVVIVSLRL